MAFDWCRLFVLSFLKHNLSFVHFKLFLFFFTISSRHHLFCYSSDGILIDWKQEKNKNILPQDKVDHYSCSEYSVPFLLWQRIWKQKLMNDAWAVRKVQYISVFFGAKIFCYSFLPPRSLSVFSLCFMAFQAFVFVPSQKWYWWWWICFFLFNSR